MRKLCAVAAALALSFAPSSSGAPGPGYLDATSNVTFVANIPLDADTAGARLLGKTFYVLTAKGLTIYDVSNPTLPLPARLHAAPAHAQPGARGRRHERQDPRRGAVVHRHPVRRRRVEPRARRCCSPRCAAPPGHTNTCVLSCKWVYSSDGDIIDLRDPKNPKLAGDWRDPAGVRGSHDWTEVRPGLLMGATNPVVYLDARKNPAKPKRIALGKVPDGRYIHGNVWPRAGKDRFLLVGSESGMLCGTPKDGSFMVYDTKNHEKTKSFKYLGDYSLAKGMPTEGRAQVNQHCGHWFQPHPSFKDGGLVAVAWYGFGTRFVEVTKTGKIVEKGWFLGGGAASSAYWISPDVVYSLDYVRGIDIIKFDRKAKPTSSGRGQWNPVSPFAVFSDREPVRDGKPYVCPLPL